MKYTRWVIKKGKRCYVVAGSKDYTSSLRKAYLFDTKAEALYERDCSESEVVVKVEVTIREI